VSVGVEEVELLDGSGRTVGVAEKLEAHRGEGLLHRAFSVFLLRSDGAMLVHRRASAKHHFRDLWTNSCCSHPRPGEPIVDAAVRRVREELGIDLDPSSLREVGAFEYRARDEDSGLVEHEWDHVVLGRSDVDPEPDPAEVGDWRWVRPEDLRAEFDDDPTRFTPWFPLAWSVLDDALAPTDS
jgi:isopentenyl-diphosphate delta-isomerase